MIEPLVEHQEIVRGDDYKAAEGRALTWYSAEWPNIAGATLELVAGYTNANVFGSVPVVWKDTVPASPAPVYVAHLSLSHAQTKELPEGCYDYILRATLLDGDIVTLALGKLTCQAEPGLAPLQPAQP